VSRWSLICPARALGLTVLAAFLVSCSSTPAPETFDLSAPREVKASGGGRAQLVVVQPTALQVIDSDRIIVRPKVGQVTYLTGAQWADRLPTLVQTRLIQTFENAHKIASVGRPDDKFVADATLVSEIRTFEIDASQGSEAVVEMSGKLVNERSGRITAAKLFAARVPAAGTTGPQASAALDRALQEVLRDIVAWATPRV
jgi:cholesterol transport system auxiliary component